MHLNVKFVLDTSTNSQGGTYTFVDNGKGKDQLFQEKSERFVSLKENYTSLAKLMKDCIEYAEAKRRFVHVKIEIISFPLFMDIENEITKAKTEFFLQFVQHFLQGVSTPRQLNKYKGKHHLSILTQQRSEGNSFF